MPPIYHDIRKPTFIPSVKVGMKSIEKHKALECYFMHHPEDETEIEGENENINNQIDFKCGNDIRDVDH